MTSSTSSGKKKGREGEEKVKSFLKKYAKIHRLKLTNGIYLPMYNDCCEIDHILFGDFGVVVIETKNISGKIFGNDKDKFLVHQIGTKTHKLYNPVLQNETHCKNVTHHLNKAGIKNVPVYSIVVFSDRDIFIENSKIGVKLIGLQHRLEKLQPAGFDAKKLYKIILKQKVRNPFKKLWHNIKIKFFKNKDA